MGCTLSRRSHESWGLGRHKATTVEGNAAARCQEGCTVVSGRRLCNLALLLALFLASAIFLAGDTVGCGGPGRGRDAGQHRAVELKSSLLQAGAIRLDRLAHAADRVCSSQRLSSHVKPSESKPLHRRPMCNGRCWIG